MRALIDATALGSGRGGDETMLRAVVRGLGIVGGDDRFVTLLDPSADRTGLRAPVIDLEPMTRMPGAIHFGAQLPWYLAKHRSDLDVALTVTHAPVRSPVPIALMVLDLSFLHLPEVYPRRTRLRLTSLVGYQVHQAAAVLTISDFCRRDLIDSYGLEPERVHVVPLAIESAPPLSEGGRGRAAAVLSAHGVTRPFILYLGNLHPRKNVPRAIRAFVEARRIDSALRELQFVVAGARWWGSGEAEAAATAPPGSVVFMGRVEDDTRRVLLEQAEALVYVSRFEGFGLPPLEAMAVGTPVLAADAAALPEVTGGAALLVDPDDDRAICEGLRGILTDGPLRAELITRGRVRASHFDLPTTGAATKSALEAVVHQDAMARWS